jgi:hypothetical protein
VKRWALIHAASGAIVALSPREAASVPAGITQVEAPDGITDQSHWWNGSAFAARQDAAIALPVPVAEAGTALSITKPTGGWYALTDGTLANGSTVTIQAGYKENRFTLVGKYRGEVAVAIAAAGTALTTVQAGLVAQVKTDAERRKMAAFSNGFGKSQEYVQKGKEAAASAGLLASVLNALTAASAAAQYPMANAERIMTGDTLANVLASYRAGKAASDAELARLSAIERKSVLAIKAATSAAAKQAAYAAINWNQII